MMITMEAQENEISYKMATTKEWWMKLMIELDPIKFKIPAKIVIIPTKEIATITLIRIQEQHYQNHLPNSHNLLNLL